MKNASFNIFENIISSIYATLAQPSQVSTKQGICISYSWVERKFLFWLPGPFYFRIISKIFLYERDKILVPRHYIE